MPVLQGHPRPSFKYLFSNQHTQVSLSLTSPLFSQASWWRCLASWWRCLHAPHLLSLLPLLESGFCFPFLYLITHLWDTSHPPVASSIGNFSVSSFIYLCILSFVCSLILSFIHSFAHSFILSFAHSFITHSFIHLLSH